MNKPRLMAIILAISCFAILTGWTTAHTFAQDEDSRPDGRDILLGAERAKATTEEKTEDGGGDLADSSDGDTDRDAAVSSDSDSDIDGDAAAETENAQKALEDIDTADGDSTDKENADTDSAEKDGTGSSQDDDSALTQSDDASADDESAPDSAQTDSAEAEDDSSPAEDKPASQADADASQKDDLTIASWGGAYEKSQALAYFGPFVEETGIKITAVSHKGDFSPLNRDEDGKAVGDWDVVDMSFAEAEKACNRGLLELIDPADLSPAKDGQAVRDDFFGEALQPCGVASMAWSSVIVYDERAFRKKKKKPATLKDFFDVKRFPGKRALRKGARYNLELALMADGVEPGKVYSTLQTDEGLERALKKLETLRRHIIWWEKPEEPLQLLNKRKAVLATSYNGRTFFVIAGQSQPFGLIWDGQIYDMDLWTIPRAARNKEGALKFISFATQPERLAAQTNWFPYGPMRKSAVPLIGQHAEVGIDMARFVPTAAGNFDKALAFDGIWWDRQKERLDTRFASWLANPPKKAAPKKRKRRKVRPKRKKKN